MRTEKADTCEECDRPISDEPDTIEDGWPRSRWYDDLCVPCGVDRFIEEEWEPRSNE